MTAMGEDIRFGLLGSLEVTAGGQPVTLPGRRVRALLAMLVLRANQAVSTERIIGGLWGAEPPKAARESVHYFVHQLRKALPHAEGDRRGMLERHDRSYLLRVPPESIDVVRFQRGVEAAGAARDRGDWQAAWQRYAEALALWRGPALDDLAEVPFAAEEITRLTERRLVAIEHQMAVGLELGRHGLLVSELDAQLRGNPDREELRRLLMLALYRSGRQAEALQVYQGARAQLAGQEPGARLRQLQRAILTQDPALDLHPGDPSTPAGLAWAAEAAQPPATPRPAQRVPHPAAVPAREPDTPVRPGERRLVTALVVGVTTDQDRPGGDPEEVRARTEKLLAGMTARVRHYGGAAQVTPLGELLATFGADRAREDDPERAVRAALDIVNPEVPDPTAAARAGVATGEVLVTYHPDGANDAVGEVDIVARMLAQTAPPGAVLVSAATHQATRRTVSYTTVQPTADLTPAAGRRLWRAFAPRGRTGAQVAERPATPLLERERELGLLRDVLAQLRRRRLPHLVTVVCDSGLGKSRLVAELAGLVDQAPELITWRVGYARRDGQEILGPLADIVRAEVGILVGEDAPTVQGKVQEALALAALEHDDQVTAALGMLLGVSDPTALASQSDVVADTLARYVAAVADRRPLVLVFEDLQWADEQLVEFVAQLPRRVGDVPLLVVATARTEFLHQQAGWGGGQPNTVTITLPPLSRDGTRALLDALLADAPLPEPAMRALLDAAGGNPLFVEEYVHMLVGHDAPATHSGDALAVPTSVAQVIAARLDTLPHADRRLLVDAAVIGEPVYLGQLAAVSDTEGDAVASGLQRLVRGGLLRRVRVSSVAAETEFAFRHPLIREVAYGQLLRAARIAKHQRAAAWIESRSPDQSEQVEPLAYHYTRVLELTRAAGQPLAPETAGRARQVLIAAGDHATQLGASRVAARSYRNALTLCPPDDPGRPELLDRLGAALASANHGGREELQPARAAAPAASDTSRLAQIDALLGTLATDGNDDATPPRA